MKAKMTIITDKGLIVKASTKCPCKIANSALDPPHPGQGSLVMNLNGHLSGN